MKRIVAAVLLGAVCALAQVNRVAAPSLGFVNADGGLQPILGIAGSARLATPIPASNVTNIAIAPGSRYALAERDGAVAIASLADPADAGLFFSSIAGSAAQSATIIFSPSGSAAGIYSPQLNLVQVLAGLPDAPQVSGKLETAEALDHLAISDDGQVLLAREANGRIVNLGNDETVFQSASLADMAFVPGSHSAYALDRAGHALLALRSDSATKVALKDDSILATADTLRPAADSSILLGSGSTHTVWVVDASTGNVNSYPVEDGVKHFSLLAAKDTYLMQYASGGYGVATWRNGKLMVSFVGIARDGGAQ